LDYPGLHDTVFILCRIHVCLDFIPHRVDRRAMRSNIIRIHLNPISCKQSLKSQIQYNVVFTSRLHPNPISILIHHAVLQIGHVQILLAIFIFQLSCLVARGEKSNYVAMLLQFNTIITVVSHLQLKW